MGDSPSPVLSPDEHDLSHVNEITRLRMERVRELEQQRLRRVLAQSRTHVQGPGPVPDTTQQDVSTQSGATRSPLLGSRSLDIGRNRSRVVNISRTRGAALRIQETDEGAQETVTVSEVALPSRNISGDLKVSDESFINKLKQLIDTTDSPAMRARYLRLLEKEQAKIEESQLSGESHRVSRLSRSASVNERRNLGRINRTRSSDQSGRTYSPSRSTNYDNEPVVTVRSSPLDFGFQEILNKRQEGLKRIEELEKQREQRLATARSASDMQTVMTQNRIEPFSYVSSGGPQSYSSLLTRRTSDMPIHYSSISELHEPYETNFSPMNPVTGSLENLHLNRRSSFEVIPSSVTSSHTTARGSAGNIYTPAISQYTETRQSEPASFSLVYEQDDEPSEEVKARKKRSLLHKEGITDHVLMECFDPEFTFEERICSIREKLYGSRVLIPSDKQPEIGQRGRPDGASEGTIVTQGGDASDSATLVQSQA